MRFYPAIVTKDEGGAYIAQAIDLDNVFSEGATPEEAIANAGDALAAVLDVMTEHGDKIPEPTPIDMAEAMRRTYGDIVTMVYLKAPPPRTKATKISVTIDEELLRRIDAAVGNYGRSEFLAKAAREKLARETQAAIPELDIKTAKFVTVKFPKSYIDEIERTGKVGTFMARMEPSKSGGAPRMILEPVPHTQGSETVQFTETIEQRLPEARKKA